MSQIDALDALEARRVVNIGKQVDNASLSAGSPMYYYCLACGAETAVLAEDWYETMPPKHCDSCRPLVEDGIIQDNYDSWLRSRGEKPVPR